MSSLEFEEQPPVIVEPLTQNTDDVARAGVLGQRIINGVTAAKDKFIYYPAAAWDTAKELGTSLWADIDGNPRTAGQAAFYLAAQVTEKSKVPLMYTPHAVFSAFLAFGRFPIAAAITTMVCIAPYEFVVARASRTGLSAIPQTTETFVRKTPVTNSLDMSLPGLHEPSLEERRQNNLLVRGVKHAAILPFRGTAGLLTGAGTYVSVAKAKQSEAIKAGVEDPRLSDDHIRRLGNRVCFDEAVVILGSVTYGGIRFNELIKTDPHLAQQIGAFIMDRAHSFEAVGVLLGAQLINSATRPLVRRYVKPFVQEKSAPIKRAGSAISEEIADTLIIPDMSRFKRVGQVIGQKVTQAVRAEA